MKLITRDTDYAFRAICFLSKRKGQIVCVNELVRELKIPRPFLRKILQVLNKKGVLHSSKGQDGGFRLAIAAERIFLLDLIKIFQGRLELNECLFKKSACPRIKTCILRKKIAKIEKYVLGQLRPVSIASLSRR
jgi:Rrf2 family protein